MHSYVSKFKKTPDLIFNLNSGFKFSNSGIPYFKKAVIYKRFIDDIIFIAIGENSTQNIIKAIENSLQKLDFK